MICKKVNQYRWFKSFQNSTCLPLASGTSPDTAPTAPNPLCPSMMLASHSTVPCSVRLEPRPALVKGLSYGVKQNSISCTYLGRTLCETMLSLQSTQTVNCNLPKQQAAQIIMSDLPHICCDATDKPLRFHPLTACVVMEFKIIVR